jgi:hypothetical protein
MKIVLTLIEADEPIAVSDGMSGHHVLNVGSKLTLDVSAGSALVFGEIGHFTNKNLIPEAQELLAEAVEALSEVSEAAPDVDLEQVDEAEEKPAAKPKKKKDA